MTKEEFKDIIIKAENLFVKGVPDFTTEMRDAWYEAMEELDYEEARGSLMDHARKSEWFPSIADFYMNIPKKSEFGMTDEEFNALCDKHMGADEW